MPKTTTSLKGNSYNGAIDFWKFIFCLIILVFHVGEAFGQDKYPFYLGKYAVEFFFVISGYLMCVSASRKEAVADVNLGRETLSFVLHKVKAILPAYLLAFIVAWINWFNFTGQELLAEKGIKKFVLKNLDMLPDFLLVYMAGYDGTVIIRITWYISAMLIAMLLLYPLLRRFKDMFLMVIAPLLVFFFCGYLANTSDYNGIMKYEGFLTHGMIRAIIGLCLGAMVYCFSRYIKKQNLTSFSRVLLSLCEFAGYLTILFLMDHGKEESAYIILILLFFTVAVTASKQAITATVFDNRIFRFLGQFSLYVYLFQSPARIIIREMYPDSTYTQALYRIIALTLIFAILGWLIVRLLSRGSGKLLQRIRPIFIR